MLPHEAHGLCRGCYSLFRYHKHRENKLNLCLCGCGQKCFDKYILGHNSKLENNPNWTGGFIIDKDGYIRVNIDGKMILLHRLIYEEYYNCCLLSYVVLHHIDGNKLNNKISNLKPLYRDQHLIIHDPLSFRWKK